MLRLPSLEPEEAFLLRRLSHKRLVALAALAYIVIMVNIVKENSNAAITTRR